MEFKGSIVILFVAVAICSVQNASGFPRDSSVVKADDLVQNINDETVLKRPVVTENTVEGESNPKNDEVTTHIDEEDQEHDTVVFPKGQDITDKAVRMPVEIRCQHEEATEDLVCQEHCLPKGYSYGLCVSHKCSCI